MWLLKTFQPGGVASYIIIYFSLASSWLEIVTNGGMPAASFYSTDEAYRNGDWL